MLINLEKLKLAHDINTKLQDHTLNKFMQNSNKYFTILENDIKNIKPTEALDIVSLLVSFREYFNSESEWERLTLHSLDIIRKGISRTIFDKHAVFDGLTHVAFVIHNLSLTAPNIKPFLVGIYKILLDNLSSYLNKSSNEELYESGSYEAIKGLSGPLRYLLNFINDEQMYEIANDIVKLFINRSKEKTINGHKVTGWHYYPSEEEKTFMAEDAINGVVNYGLSHGMGGPLVTLALAYKNGIRLDGLENAINGLISEYMDMSYHVNDIVYWPGRITLKQRVGLDEINRMPNQMSWCYGSVGILRVLYMTGVYMSNTNVEQFALNELLKITKMEINDFMLSQPIVCHGFAGTAAILNVMYLETGNLKFLHKAIELVEVSVLYDIERFFETENQLAKSRNLISRASLHNHLEGYLGILQSILSIVTGCLNENDKRLLIT